MLFLVLRVDREMFASVPFATDYVITSTFHKRTSCQENIFLGKKFLPLTSYHKVSFTTTIAYESLQSVQFVSNGTFS